MSTDNVRVVRKVFEGVRDGDEERVLRHLSPDVVWHPTAFLTGESEFTGHDGVRRWMRALKELVEAGTDVATFPNEFDDLGDGRVLVLGEGKLNRDEGQLKQDLAWLWKLDDEGLVVEMANYLDPADAVRDAGAGG